MDIAGIRMAKYSIENGGGVVCSRSPNLSYHDLYVDFLVSEAVQLPDGFNERLKLSLVKVFSRVPIPIQLLNDLSR